MFRKLVFIFILSFATSILGQFSNLPGTPFIKNFSQKKIKIFDTSQNINGEMYFATAGSLVEFDGFRFTNYSIKEQTDLRAVLYIDDQHIYTSGHGGFGLWSKNNKGILEYKSLFFKYPTKTEQLLPTFSNIIEMDGKILFQSFWRIYIYNPSNEKLTSIQAFKGFSGLYLSNKRAFVQDVSIGLFELINFEKKIVKGTETVDIEVIGVFEEKNESLLIVTKNKGFWTSKDGVLVKKDWEVNREIEKFIITDVEAYTKDKFIAGTLRNGFYIISNKGEKIAHFNKSNGLENNAIRTVFKDSNNNVWVGTESGISYVEVNSRTKYLLDTKSNFGTVYASLLKDSLLYLGTNQGLFTKNINKPLSEPKLINNNTQQIWHIDEIDGQILVGGHKGVSVLENNFLKTIHSEGGGWVFKKHPKISNILYIGFYSGIAVFQKTDNQWKFLKKFDAFGESSRFIEFDQYGHLWVAHPSKGYYRLKLSLDGLNLKEIEFYGVKTPNVETYAYFCKIDGSLVFYNPKGFFYFDALENSFIKAKYPSEIFKGLNNINYIHQDDNIFWYATPNLFGYLIRSGNLFKNTKEPFYTFWSKHLNDFNKFKKINKNSFAIGIDNGIIFHEFNSKIKKPVKSSLTLKSLKFISATDTIIGPITSKSELKIPNSHNYLKIKIALPNVPLSNSKQFQYKLKGLEDFWSPWIYDSEINFPGLTAGDYVLQLRVSKEDSMSQNIEIPFHILYPWYISNTAKIIYILSFLFIFISYRSFLQRKNEKYVKRLKLLENQKRERQKAKFELDKLGIDKELLLLKEENLNLEIKKKNAALASSTLNNIKKNELLADLVIDIKKIDKELVNSSLHFPVKKVIKKINNHLLDKEDWLTFQLHFTNTHAKFFQNLQEKHPELSSNEIKLSAYLKLNLSTKEIASLMNVAITSVEQSRYRLRKKINLDKDVNLVNYIQKI